MDRIGRLLGNVFAPPAPNGNGAKALAPIPEKKQLRATLAPADFWPVNGRGDVFDTADLDRDWYTAHWLAYACMKYRAVKLIEAPLWIAEERNGEESWLEGTHPLAPLLERPNLDMEMSDLLFATSILLDSGGHCLWVKNRDRLGGVGSMYPFGAEKILEVKGDGQRLYARFHVQTASGPVWYDAEDVIYFREYGAVAPLQVAAARLGLDATLLESMRAGIRNSVTPGASLEFPPEVQLDETQVEELKGRIAAQYEGARNNGRLFVGGSAKLTRHQLGFAGLEGGEIAKETEAAVCGAFGVHPAVVGAYVGLENSSDRANMETAERLFYDVSLLPRWAWLEKVLTRQLLRPVDDDSNRYIRFVRDKVAALQEDVQERATIQKDAADVLTVNERRALMGYPPIPGGDEPPSQRQPAPEPPREEEEAEEEEAKAEAKAMFDPDTVAWRLYHATTEAQEYGWKLAALSQLRADRDAIVAAAEELLRPAKKDDGPPVSPADPASVAKLIREVDAMLSPDKRAAFRNVMRQLGEDTGKRSVQQLSTTLGVSFDLLQPGLLSFAEEEAAWLVTEIDRTTRDSITAALKAGLEEGAGIRRGPDSQVPSLLERVMDAGAFSESRAELIARTETTRVTNGAARASLEKYQRTSGNRIRKTWLAAKDDRVRDEHRELDGESRAIDEAFSNGLQAPGEPNCRCTLLYAMED